MIKRFLGGCVETALIQVRGFLCIITFPFYLLARGCNFILAKIDSGRDGKPRSNGGKSISLREELEEDKR